MRERRKHFSLRLAGLGRIDVGEMGRKDVDEMGKKEKKEKIWVLMWVRWGKGMR